jgi:hypothetical protein
VQDEGSIPSCSNRATAQKELNMLTELFEKGFKDLDKNYTENKERLQRLGRFQGVDTGGYHCMLSYNLRSVSVSIQESQLKQAIRHFKAQFPKATGKVTAVVPNMNTFLVNYEIVDGFSLLFWTMEPEKYLDKSCKVVEQTVKAVVCESAK